MAARSATPFGAFVVRRMRIVGMEKQQDLVEATGISAATVSRLIVSDEYEPDLRTLRRLADALKVSLLELVARYEGIPIDDPVGSLGEPIPPQIVYLIEVFGRMPEADRPTLLERVEWVTQWGEFYMERRLPGRDEQADQSP